MSNRVEYLKPLNRYVTIIPHFNENRAETGVLLPEDFKQEDSRFIKATIVHVATDCKDDLKRMKNQIFPFKLKEKSICNNVFNLCYKHK